MNIHAVPAWLKHLGNAWAPGLVWERSPDSKAIYLTFDDGPVPGPTEFVLDTLAAWGAKGTFFAVGDNVRKHPDLARRIVQEGHRLGNHTQRHLKGWQCSLEEYLADVASCQEFIHETTGTTPELFRPPYGRIRPSQAKALHASGFQLIMWSVLTADYDPALSPGACLTGSYPHCKPGSIVVFHDSHKAAVRMEKVLPALLHVLSDEGYKFHALA
jgi:peptidoglycan/xylan/chitin deacetylase (PgdA/CDA1 family)